MIIIPDIHGRTFWKEAVKGYEGEEIVFLGDYLDPYPDEHVGDPLPNFKDIIEFKKLHPKNITLLIGNHDQHYFIDGAVNGSRFNSWRFREFNKAFKENYDLFQLCLEKEIDGKRYIMSHAGILRGWLNRHFSDRNIDDSSICDYLNNAYLSKFDTLGYRLSDISVERWGPNEYGSMTWADVNEHFKEKENHVADYQIFGHTQLSKQPVVTDRFACLDVRRAFILTDKGEITELDGTPVIKYEELIKNLSKKNGE